MNFVGRSRTAAFLFNLLLVAGIGAVNYASATDITLLYLFPILNAAWLVGAWAGTVMALLSALLWLVYDLSFLPLSAPFTFHAWQAAIRFFLFLAASLTMSRLKKELTRERLLSRSDELTGAANRRYFFEVLNAELSKLKRSRHPLTLVYMDVDDFKSINDRLGHEAGDDFLRLTAAILRENTRAYDLVARLGGDEFAVILPETDFDHARETVSKLHDRLRAVRRKGYRTTFSLGSLTLADAPASADEAVRLADTLMYDVKRSGKDSMKAELYAPERSPAPAAAGRRS